MLSGVLVARVLQWTREKNIWKHATQSWWNHVFTSVCVVLNKSWFEADVKSQKFMWNYSELTVLEVDAFTPDSVHVATLSWLPITQSGCGGFGCFVWNKMFKCVSRIKHATPHTLASEEENAHSFRLFFLTARCILRFLRLESFLCFSPNLVQWSLRCPPFVLSSSFCLPELQKTSRIIEQMSFRFLVYQRKILKIDHRFCFDKETDLQKGQDLQEQRVLIFK